MATGGEADGDAVAGATAVDGPSGSRWFVLEHVASEGTVEPISVDALPGVIIGDAGESVAVWRATDEVVVGFRTSGSRDELVAAMEALQPVDVAAWLDHFAPHARPDPPTTSGG